MYSNTMYQYLVNLYLLPMSTSVHATATLPVTQFQEPMSSHDLTFISVLHLPYPSPDDSHLNYCNSLCSSLLASSFFLLQFKLNFQVHNSHPVICFHKVILLINYFQVMMSKLLSQSWKALNSITNHLILFVCSQPMTEPNQDGSYIMYVS